MYKTENLIYKTEKKNMSISLKNINLGFGGLNGYSYPIREYTTTSNTIKPIKIKDHNYSFVVH